MSLLIMPQGQEKICSRTSHNHLCKTSYLIDSSKEFTTVECRGMMHIRENLPNLQIIRKFKHIYIRHTYPPSRQYCRGHPSRCRIQGADQGTLRGSRFPNYSLLRLMQLLHIYSSLREEDLQIYFQIHKLQDKIPVT